MSVKQYILRWKKEIDSYRECDDRARRYLETLEEQSTDIRENVEKMGQLDALFPDDDERAEIFMMMNEEMEELNRVNKELKAEYLEYMKQAFPEFSGRYLGIFEMFVDGKKVDGRALTHCLDTFTRYENGDISLEQGKTVGYQQFFENKNK